MEEFQHCEDFAASSSLKPVRASAALDYKNTDKKFDKMSTPANLSMKETIPAMQCSIDTTSFTSCCKYPDAKSSVAESWTSCTAESGYCSSMSSISTLSSGRLSLDKLSTVPPSKFYGCSALGCTSAISRSIQEAVPSSDDLFPEPKLCLLSAFEEDKLPGEETLPCSQTVVRRPVLNRSCKRRSLDSALTHSIHARDTGTSVLQQQSRLLDRNPCRHANSRLSLDTSARSATPYLLASDSSPRSDRRRSLGLQKQNVRRWCMVSAGSNTRCLPTNAISCTAVDCNRLPGGMVDGADNNVYDADDNKLCPPPRTYDQPSSCAADSLGPICSETSMCSALGERCQPMDSACTARESAEVQIDVQDVSLEFPDVIPSISTFHLDRRRNSAACSTLVALSEPALSSHDSGFESSQFQSFMSSDSFLSNTSLQLSACESLGFGSIPLEVDSERLIARRSGENRLSEEQCQRLRDLMPREPDRIIGRKMGLDCVDVIRELQERNMSGVLTFIFSCLTVDDLTRVCCVSKTWRNALHCNVKAKCRLDTYLSTKSASRPSKENSVPCKKQMLTQRMTKAKEPLAQLQPAEGTSGSQVSVQTRGMQNAERYWKEANQLKNTEILLKCPKCQRPARKESDQDRARCTDVQCKFDFCAKCLLPFHVSPQCPVSEVRVRTDATIGTKQSKKNLRRL